MSSKNINNKQFLEQFFLLENNQYFNPISKNIIINDKYQNTISQYRFPNPSRSTTIDDPRSKNYFHAFYTAKNPENDEERLVGNINLQR